MPTKKENSFRFYEHTPKNNDNINVPEIGGREQFLPNQRTPYTAKDLKNLPMGSAERIQAYKDLGWAQDDTTTGHGDYVDPNAMAANLEQTRMEKISEEVGDGEGPTDDAPLSRRELRQQGRRDRKSARVENLQRKRENLSEPGDAKYERLLSREHRMAKRQANVGEGARKFRDRRDKVMGAVRDSKVGRFFKGNTSKT
mgnify:CR=1 FL=1